MKPFISLFACLLLFNCCQKNAGEYEFAVVCKIPLQYSGGAGTKLIVTNPQGDIVRIFDIPAGVTEIQRRFNVPAETPLETCNLHIVFRPDSGSPFHEIFSHLEVRSGALVAFEPAYLAPLPISQQKVIRINGLESLDSLALLGGHTLVPNMYDPFEKKGLVSAVFQQMQGALVQIKANGSPEFRYAYVPESILSQAAWDYAVDWAGFKPVPPSRTVKTAPGMLPVSRLDVDAVSPGFGTFVSVGPASDVDPGDPGFIHPDEVPQVLRIRLEGRDFAAEKIFDNGEPLEMEAPDMQIRAALYSSDRRLHVEVTGDVDLLEVISQEAGTYVWKVQGAPSAFAAAAMPDLPAVLPQLQPASAPFSQFLVQAHHYDRHDYPQIREGFPQRSGGLFPVARSGYSMVRKNY